MAQAIGQLNPLANGPEHIFYVKRISQLPRESRLSISIRKLWQDSVPIECTELSTVLCVRS
jgi:hypothetical protein